LTRQSAYGRRAYLSGIHRRAKRRRSSNGYRASEATPFFERLSDEPGDDSNIDSSINREYTAEAAKIARREAQLSQI
jgi:hypothetical protein